MNVSIEEAVQADEATASKHDRPAWSGLQAMTQEARDALMAYLSTEFAPTWSVSYGLTSYEIAILAHRHLKKNGIKAKVTNHMIKSALHLLGYKPTVTTVDIWNYRIKKKSR